MNPKNAEMEKYIITVNKENGITILISVHREHGKMGAIQEFKQEYPQLFLNYNFEIAKVDIEI